MTGFQIQPRGHFRGVSPTQNLHGFSVRSGCRSVPVVFDAVPMWLGSWDGKARSKLGLAACQRGLRVRFTTAAAAGAACCLAWALTGSSMAAIGGLQWAVAWEA